jgi:hypothetical protein
MPHVHQSAQRILREIRNDIDAQRRRNRGPLGPQVGPDGWQVPPPDLLEEAVAPQMRQENGTFSLIQSTLDDRPKEFLCSLGLLLIACRGQNPAGWRFELQGPDAIAFDAGGVKRDVSYRLVQNLFTRGQDGLHHYGEPPQVRPAAAEDADIEAYRNLGRVLYIPLRFEAPIGALFDKPCYEALSKALQNPDLLQDTAEARATLANLIYKDSILTELAAEGIAGLSQVNLDRLIELLEEVSPELVRECKGFAALVRPSERSQVERETLAYLLLRHPELGGWLDDPQSALSADILMRLTPFLERQDPDLLPELDSGLQQAQAKLEERFATIRWEIAKIDAKENPSKQDKLKQQQLSNQLRAIPKLVLSEEQRARIQGALQRQVQMEPDFSTLLVDLASDTTEQGIRRGLERLPLYQEVGSAIQAMASGIQDMWPAGTALSELTPERLTHDLEGAISIGDLKAGCPLHQDYQNEAQAQQTHAWLMQWIDASSEEDRRKFCAAVTGSGALVMQPPDGGPPIRVIYTGAAAETLPSTHTCFRQLDLPKTYPSYEHFKEKLELLINEGGGFGLR